MSIGTIIFIITIAISLFSAVSDKSHEKRQKQNKPQNNKTAPQKSGGFLENVQQKLEEFERELSDFDEPNEPSQQQPAQQLKRKKTVRPEPTQFENKLKRQSQKRKKIKSRL